MFDKTLRELKRLERGIRVPIQRPLDDAGYLDRQCPGTECRRHFKVLFEHWRDKVPEEGAFCPFCGHADAPTEWNTPGQAEHIKAAGLAHISRELDKALAADARLFNLRQRMRPSRGLIDISMSMNYRPGSRRVSVPPAAAEALRQNFECEECGCHWSSLGASFFCPACGHNSAEGG